MITKAYASLQSLMTVVDQILHYPNPHIAILHRNLQLFQSLYQTLTFLQDFLEVYSHDVNVSYDFLRCIADAACSAEDVIESHIANHLYSIVPKKMIQKIEQILDQPFPCPHTKEHFQSLLEKLSLLECFWLENFRTEFANQVNLLKYQIGEMIYDLQKVLLQVTNLSLVFSGVYSRDVVIENMVQKLHSRITLLKEDFGSIDCEKMMQKLLHFSESYEQIALAEYKAEDSIESIVVEPWNLFRDILVLIQFEVRRDLSVAKDHFSALNENVSLLKHFLEFASNGSTYEAEDVIGSSLGNQIPEEDNLYQHLNKIMQEIDIIKKEAMEIKDKIGIPGPQPQGSSIHADSERSHSTLQKINELEGFEDLLSQVLDKLTGEHDSSRQIISVVGMSGIGKTTLTTTVYELSSIVEYFDIRVWVTISQTYDLRKILIEILAQLTKKKDGGRKSDEELSDTELRKKLYQCLFNRRYLLVLDDIWTIDAWEQLQLSFPKQNNGSRIMITTKISNLGPQLDSQHIIEMHFLDDDTSWNLLCKSVFRDKVCPTELEEIGKGIAKKCKGLPLSLIVIGGLLSNSEKTQKFWTSIMENLEPFLNVENEEWCLKILHKSYDHLPLHLRPCFLYMGVFHEDCEIRASMLIKQWVAEGFLKPISGKSLEEVAKQYLEELIDRNLIFVKSLGCIGNIKVCYIHDVIRLLCLREAEKEKFLYMPMEHNLEVDRKFEFYRIAVVHQRALAKESLHQVLNALQSTSTIRSFLCDGDGDEDEVPFQLTFKLLKVCNLILGHEFSSETRYSAERFCSLANLRFLAFNFVDIIIKLPDSIYCNLQTLIVPGNSSILLGIWHMPQIRHIKVFSLKLPDPTTVQNEIVLWNLQTLCNLHDFKLCNEVVKRTPNIQKLKLEYMHARLESFYLNNLACFQKLESLSLKAYSCSTRSYFRDEIDFPCSLKKLHLAGVELEWEDIMPKIGSLPCLQVLRLKHLDAEGKEWNIEGGEFQCLKFLEIQICNLKHWTAKNTHFPRLEQLVLVRLDELEEIPSDIGEINTLNYVELSDCSDSAIKSAQRILDEQAQFGNLDLKLQVYNNIKFEELS